MPAINISLRGRFFPLAAIARGATDAARARLKNVERFMIGCFRILNYFVFERTQTANASNLMI